MRVPRIWQENRRPNNIASADDLSLVLQGQPLGTLQGRRNLKASCSPNSLAASQPLLVQGPCLMASAPCHFRMARTGGEDVPGDASPSSCCSYETLSHWKLASITFLERLSEFICSGWLAGELGLSPQSGADCASKICIRPERAGQAGNLSPVLRRRLSKILILQYILGRIVGRLQNETVKRGRENRRSNGICRERGHIYCYLLHI